MYGNVVVHIKSMFCVHYGLSTFTQSHSASSFNPQWGYSSSLTNRRWRGRLVTQVTTTHPASLNAGTGRSFSWEDGRKLYLYIKVIGMGRVIVTYAMCYGFLNLHYMVMMTKFQCEITERIQKQLRGDFRANNLKMLCLLGGKIRQSAESVSIMCKCADTVIHIFQKLREGMGDYGMVNDIYQKCKFTKVALFPTKKLEKRECFWFVLGLL